MNKHYDNYLVKKFPYMFRERFMPMHQTCMCWGFACGDGWFDLIRKLCLNIESHVKWKRNERAKALMFNRKLKRALAANNMNMLINPKFADQEWHKVECFRTFNDKQYKLVPDRVERVVVNQVKEKFGTLRFYYSGGDDAVFGMVQMAESMSSCICEECGARGKTNNAFGYVVTQCKTHFNLTKKKRSEQFN